MFTRGLIVGIAQAVLCAEVGVVAGSRRLSEYGSRLYTATDDPVDEKSFAVFDKVVSETMHLPVDWERGNWSEEALRRKDDEIAEYEAKVKKGVSNACRKLIKRYEVYYPCT